MRPLATRSSVSGFTLLEVVISTSVSVTIVGALFAFLHSSLGATQATSTLARLDGDSSRAIQHIVQELWRASGNTLAPTGVPHSSSLSYQSAVGWDGSSLIFGPPTIVEWQSSAGDPNDGVDNDGNGLVDDGTVVLRINPNALNEQRQVLATGVPELLEGELANLQDDNGNGLIDECGLTFDFTRGLTLRLTLQRRDSGGRMFTRTLETAVAPRN